MNNKIRFFRLAQPHPLNFIILPFLFLVITFISQSLQSYLIILTLTFINLFILARPIKYKLIFIFALCMLPVIPVTLLSTYFFKSVSNVHPVYISSLLSIKYISIAMVSYCFAIHTPFTHLFHYLIEKKLLSVKIGYSMLAAISSFHFLAEEFKRIQIAYKMRYRKTFISPVIFIALLTAAARYAHNLSVSMYCRHINQDKTFVIVAPKATKIEYILWFANLIIIISLIYQA